MILHIQADYMNKPSKAHNNTLIYDTVNKTLERFEPHGAITEGGIVNSHDRLLLDRALEEKFSQYIPISRYFSPLDFCPRIGVQGFDHLTQTDIEREPGGYCHYWSVWYADYRLSNPNIDRETALEDLMQYLSVKEGGIYNFKQFVRSYAVFISTI